MERVSASRKTLRLKGADSADVLRAAEILRGGGTVAFPTETVYGLGANALSPEAVEKIFIAKQRPHWDPLIVHIADRSQLASLVSAVSCQAEQLMDAFWPGPLTLLLPRTPAMPDAVTAGRPLVGVRMPAHALALSLLRAANLPIAAPSANTFGHTSPTTAEHVLADLDGRIDAVLDGGPTEVGVESTVVEMHHDPEEDWDGVILYRAGGTTTAMLERVIGVGGVVPYQALDVDNAEPASLPSPGVGIRHYAPRARLVLVEEDRARSNQPLERSLIETIDNHAGGTVGVMLPDEWYFPCADHIFHWGPWLQPEILAQRLYTGLRALDDAGCRVIVCPVPQSQGISEAIRDRLRKAARTA
jgi:L-threonylcarbamoyladenylate synthase